MSLCQECPHSQFCSSLCPEAEASLKEIEIPQCEKTIGLPRYGKFPIIPSDIPMTKREKEIVTLMGKGLSRRQIAELLGIKRESLRASIYRMNKKV